MSDKVVRDGKVAVLISGGFGGGWSTWNDNDPRLLFDPQLVAAVEAGDWDATLKRAEEIKPRGFWDGGEDDLEIEWVTEGARFRVSEYDGLETVVLFEDENWFTA